MKKNVKYVFERVEKKYMIDENKFNILMKAFGSYMEEDEYGPTTICNIYFDTLDDAIIRKSLEKPEYKEKLRLRSYGIPKGDSRVFLEIKKKFNEVVYKRRVSMSYKDAQNYLQNGIRPVGDNQIFNEIDYFMKFYKPIPKSFLAYERVAYVWKDDKNLRITFDKNIRSRKDKLKLQYGTDGEPLIDNGMRLMEIKVCDSFPLWLVHILSANEIYPISFSKYGMFYNHELKLKDKVYCESEKFEENIYENNRRENVCLQVF